MDEAEAAHDLGREVALFARERRAAGEGDSLGSVHDVAVRVLRHEAVVPRRFDVRRELVEHEVPALLFPLRAARSAVERLLDSTRARRELHRRRALRAEAALVHRAVGVALDLKDLRLAAHLFGVGHECAADGAVRADRVDFLRSGDAQVERAFLRRGDVETERVGNWNERHAGGAGGSELQEFTASDFRHRNRLSVLLRPFCPCKFGAKVSRSVNEFFESLGRRWRKAAERRGAKIEEPELDAKVALELLELARVAAHTKERRFAPLASYTAGIAAERLRAAKGADADAIAAYVREVREELEREPPV